MSERRMPGPSKGPGRQQKFERPQNIKGTLLRILSYLKPYRARLIITAFCVILASLSGVAGTYFVKPIINRYLVPFIGRSDVDLSGFAHLMLVLIAIYLVGVAASYLQQYNMMIISTAVLRQVRTDMFDHMMGLKLKYFDTHTHGEIMSRYTNDTDTLREMVSQSLPNIFSSMLTVTGVFVMMLVLSPLLTLIVVAMLGVMLLVVKAVGKRSASYFTKQQRQLGSINGYIEEMITGVKVVKVFNHEQASCEGFDRLNDDLFHAAKNAHTFGSILMPIMGNLSYLTYALISAIGAALCIGGRMDLGTIGSFLLYSRNFSNPITQISQQINTILAALAGAERIFALIDEPVEEETASVSLVRVRPDGQGRLQEAEERTGWWAWKVPAGVQIADWAGAEEPSGGSRLVPLKGDVRFSRVDFSYEPGKQVLSDISFYAKPGQKIALVGSTGAGKTTIINLITRFYEIDRGSITYDGIDIRDIEKHHLRRSVGMVLQDTHLFTGTVLDNIRYGRLDATDQECMAAARTANADYFITHLPQGYHTMITGDGANLSQGQRQLLSIARAVVNDPPVLILDEATSSIDTRTESLIEKGMDQLMQGRTTFVIAHRLSTVRNANAILVLENGHIIERGDHDDLLAQKGRYYALYTGMFELD